MWIQYTVEDFTMFLYYISEHVGQNILRKRHINTCKYSFCRLAKTFIEYNWETVSYSMKESTTTLSICKQKRKNIITACVKIEDIEDK